MEGDPPASGSRKRPKRAPRPKAAEKPAAEKGAGKPAAEKPAEKSAEKGAEPAAEKPPRRGPSFPARRTGARLNTAAAAAAARKVASAPLDAVPDPDADAPVARTAASAAEPDEDAPETGADATAPASSAVDGAGASPDAVTAPASTAFELPALTILEDALTVTALRKAFGATIAVDDIDLDIHSGAFFGFVGPNGAGKTTTLSMITGLLKPDAGTVKVYGADAWTNPSVAKRMLGVLPDRLRLFDRLTGAEYLQHAGALRRLDRQTIRNRIADLARAFDLEAALGRRVSDYSAGMVKKIGIAAAMIHSPRLLVLDEPFESVDPVSADVVIGILKTFTAAGGTVLLSSHSMSLIERVCDSVAIIAEGRVLAAGRMADVLDGRSLEERFLELAGGTAVVEGMEWLQNFSD